MKKYLFFLLSFGISKANSQSVQGLSITSPATLPNDPDAQAALEVQNRYMVQHRTGNIGRFTSTDQWIGIGQPRVPGTSNFFPVYGTRIQWNEQGYNMALRDNGNNKDALLEWGNQGGLWKLRYITDPTVSTGFRNIQLANSDGRIYMGAGDFTTLTTNSDFTLYAEAYGNLLNALSGAAIYGRASFGRSEQIGIYGDGSGGSGDGATRGVYGIAPRGEPGV